MLDLRVLQEEEDHAAGIVTSPILPGKTGRIRINGSYWSARISPTALAREIPVGAVIQAVERRGCLLLVVPETVKQPN